MARGQNNSNFFGPIPVFQKYFVKLAQNIRAGVHGRTNVEVVKLLKGADKSVLEFDVICHVRRLDDFHEWCKFWLAVVPKNGFASPVNLGNKNRQLSIHVWWFLFC